MSRTLTRKFLLLLAGFLVLQAVQLVTGIIGLVHVGTEAAAINEAGRQRMRTLLLGTLADEAVASGAWRADHRAWFDATLREADAYFARRDGREAAGRGAALRELRRQTREDWELELRPLLSAIDPASDPVSARASAARYRDLAFQRLRRVDEFVAMLDRDVREHANSLARVHGLVLALSLALGGVGLIMARHVVSGPLRRLIEATRSIAAGAYERRVPVGARDELGELAETFNRMAAAVGDRTARLNALNQTAAAISSSLSLEEILDRILKRGAAITGSSAACIAFYDAQTGAFDDWATHGLSDRFVAGMSFPSGGLAEDAFRRGEPILSNDRPGTQYRLSALAREEGIRCLVCLPLRNRASRLGVIYFYRVDRETFLEEEIETLLTFAGLAAGAIANARLHEEARNLALTDKLTGLRNRRLFDQQLSHELARAKRDGRPLALLLLDIDHFKRVNDTHGHPAGDQVLQSVARVVGSGLRECDLAARFGGEEFAVILPDTGRAGAVSVAERIRGAVAEAALRLEGGRQVRVTASIGVSVFPGGEAAPDRLLECADQALYTAKREGRNRVRLYEDTLKAQLERNPELVVDLLEPGLEHLPAIITAISAKATFFRSHSEAVTAAAMRLAAALGLSADEREALRLAALLHDIGMIAIPDTVLGKRQDMSVAELAQLKTHAAIGADLLERVPALRRIAPIVRHHHERFDGGGYPAGLRGAAIPYLARVLAVADAYGSVLSGWVGRDADSERRAMESVCARAGTELDPEIVAAFVNARPAGETPVALAATSGSAERALGLAA